MPRRKPLTKNRSRLNVRRDRFLNYDEAWLLAAAGTATQELAAAGAAAQQLATASAAAQQLAATGAAA
jgi:hypothetical protein